MKYLFCIIPVLLILLLSCSRPNKLDVLFHNLDNDGKQVYLIKVIDYESMPQIIDSGFIEKGHFTFKFSETNEPTLAYLIIKDAVPNTPNMLPFIYENGNIEMTIDSLSYVKGTPLNNSYQAFSDSSAHIGKKIRELENKINLTEELTLKYEYFLKIINLNKESVLNTYVYTKENIKNKIGELMLASMLYTFEDSQIMELLDMVSPEFKLSVNKMLDKKNEIPETSLLSGKQYLDIKGLTPSGKKISLSDYVEKNKIVLLDFWATWGCSHHTEMPTMAILYNKYKSKGLEIVGVPIDTHEQARISAIKEMNMTWPQISDIQGWNSILATIYGAKELPHTVLINQQGIVIAENLKGYELDNKLKEVLK